MKNVFHSAKSFNFKSALDVAWENKNPYNYPGTLMYTGSCSEVVACGKCGRKSTDEGSVVSCSASSPKVGATAATDCTFCENNGFECCTTPTCNNIDGSNTIFSSCPAGKNIRTDLSVTCKTQTCVDTDCCFDLLPNTEGSNFNDRSTGLRKVVDDWIAGGTAKAAIEAKYGFIENWDTSAVTRMDYLFRSKVTFNADISKCKFFFFWFCLAKIMYSY
jgi:hypothetical protein